MTAVNHRHSAIDLVSDINPIGRFIDCDLLGRVPHHRGRLRLRATRGVAAIAGGAVDHRQCSITAVGDINRICDRVDPKKSRRVPEGNCWPGLIAACEVMLVARGRVDYRDGIVRAEVPYVQCPGDRIFCDLHRRYSDCCCGREIRTASGMHCVALVSIKNPERITVLALGVERVRVRIYHDVNCRSESGSQRGSDLRTAGLVLCVTGRGIEDRY